MADDILQLVTDFCQRRDLLAGVEEVLVGFSGGADSTALLLLLQTLEVRLTAVHLHHGLRGAEADADQEWCREFCAKRDVPFLTERLDVPAKRQPGESAETAGRRLRLEFWRQHLRPGMAVALGHHLDDAVETALFRFSRGANCSGLTGLRARTEIDGVLILRPLLCLTREQVERFLTDAGVTDWRVDSTNAEVDFARNAIRLQVVPVLRKLGSDCYATLEHLQDDADYLEQAAAAVNIQPLRTDVVQTLAPALVPRVLRRWLLQESGEDLTFGGAAVNRLREALPQPGLVDFHKDWFIQITPTELLLQAKESPVLTHERHWPWLTQEVLELPELNLRLRARRVVNADWTQADPEREFFQAAAVGEEILIRPRLAGDRLLPFGGEGEVKLKKLIGDAKLNYADKRGLVVICNAAGEILWVPGVRRAELGRVLLDDTDIIEIRIRSSDLR